MSNCRNAEEVHIHLSELKGYMAGTEFAKKLSLNGSTTFL